MNTSSILLAVILAVGICSTSGDVGKCASDLASAMGEIMQDAMSGDASAAQEKTCDAMRTFVNCMLKESFKKSPTDAELNKLEEQASKDPQAKQAMEKCNINIREMSEKMYGKNGAGVSSPMPLLAATVTALGAFVLSRSL